MSVRSIGPDGIRVANATTIHHLYLKQACPCRCPPYIALVGIVNVALDKVIVLIIHIEVKVGVAVAADKYFRKLVTTEADV